MSVFMLCIITALVVTVIYQHSRIIVARRKCYDQSREISKEREATAAILGLSREAISTDISNEAFVSRFVEYTQRSLKGSGAVILTLKGENEFEGCAVAGTFPALKEVPMQVEEQLLAYPKKHTEFFKDIKIPFSVQDIEELCREKKFAFFKDEKPPWFPERFSRNAQRVLIAPIYVHSKIVACVIVVSRNEFDMYRLSEEDGEFLIRLNEIASLSMEGIRVFRERREYEKQLQTAKEEGMLQVSTGIIHNIGNAVTVAKLTVLDLIKQHETPEESPGVFLLKEIFPKMRREHEAGTLGKFLSHDESGKQYFEIMDKLINHICEKDQETSRLSNSLSAKLYHISEIVELQQRFVGELGTENMTSLATVMDSSIMIFEETCSKGGVKIKTNLDRKTPEILIDSSMMTQVFVNLIKNAVEAMQSEEMKKEHLLELSLREEKKDDMLFVVGEVKDNGPGIPNELINRIFDFGFSIRERVKTSRGYGLHTCMDTVKKYGGRIDVESELGKGSTFKVYLPVGKR